MNYCSEVIKSAGAMLMKSMDLPTDIQNEEILRKQILLYFRIIQIHLIQVQKSVGNLQSAVGKL